MGRRRCPNFRLTPRLLSELKCPDCACGTADRSCVTAAEDKHTKTPRRSRERQLGGLLKFSRIIDEINAQFGMVANWLVLLACLISAANAALRYGINGMLTVAADVPFLHGLASGIGWYGNNPNSILEFQLYIFTRMVCA